jgi:hypothetical protein
VRIHATVDRLETDSPGLDGAARERQPILDLDDLQVRAGRSRGAELAKPIAGLAVAAATAITTSVASVRLLI